jgi:translation initiation factor 6
LAIARFDLKGSPNIGVYALTNNSLTILPVKLSRKKTQSLKNVLQGELVYTTLSGTTLLGIFAAANSHGIILPQYVTDDEVTTIKKNWRDKGNVVRIPGKYTAFGNLLLVNDYGALASKYLAREPRILREIQEVLDVEVVIGEIAGLPYVGSIATATNKGVLAHPLLQDQERDLIEDVLKVPVDVGTINGGVPFVASGLLANDFGVLIGPPTTGPEIVIISNLFES